MLSQLENNNYIVDSPTFQSILSATKTLFCSSASLDHLDIFHSIRNRAHEIFRKTSFQTSDFQAGICEEIDFRFLESLLLIQNAPHTKNHRKSIISYGKQCIDYIYNHFELYKSDRIWNAILQFYISNIAHDPSQFTLEGAIGLFAQIQRFSIAPSLQAYELLMEKISRWKDVKIGLDLSRRKRIEWNLNLLESLKRSGLKPSPNVYAYLFLSCSPLTTESRSLRHCDPQWEKIENMMLKDGIGHSSFSLCSLLNVLARGQLFDEAYQRLVNLRLSGVPCTLDYYNIIFKWACHSVISSRFVLSHLRHSMYREIPNIQPNIRTYTYLIRCCVRANDLSTAMLIWQDIMTTFMKTHPDNLDIDLSPITCEIIYLAFKKYNPGLHVIDERTLAIKRNVLVSLFSHCKYKNKISEGQMEQVKIFIKDHPQFVELYPEIPEILDNKVK